jgi:hypothetical protein
MPIAWVRTELRMPKVSRISKPGQWPRDAATL